MKILSLAAGAVRALMSAILLVCLSVMSLSVLTQIIVREGFATSILPLDDIIPYSFSVSVFAGAALLFGENGNVAITIFSDILPKKLRAAVIAFSQIVILAFLAFMIHYGYEFMIDGQYQFSPLLNINLAYIYVVVPLCGLCGIILLLDSIVNPKQKNPGEGETRSAAGESDVPDSYSI